MMKATDFAQVLTKIATERKTVYLKGGFGAPITDAILKQLKKLYPSWYSAKKMEQLSKSIGTNTFGFDCVCLIKGVLWGWKGDPDAVYGGAEYLSNGVADFSVDGMAGYCKDISTDFEKIQIGEVLYQSGHVGVYIGDGLCVEATSSFAGGVLLSAVMKEKEGYPLRNSWKWHAKLNFVEYEAEQPMVYVTLPLLKRGDKLPSVKALQTLLNLHGSTLAIDGSFGPMTETAVKAFQKSNALKQEAIIDGDDWKGLIG